MLVLGRTSEYRNAMRYRPHQRALEQCNEAEHSSGGEERYPRVAAPQRFFLRTSIGPTRPRNCGGGVRNAANETGSNRPLNDQNFSIQAYGDTTSRRGLTRLPRRVAHRGLPKTCCMVTMPGTLCGHQRGPAMSCSYHYRPRWLQPFSNYAQWRREASASKHYGLLWLKLHCQRAVHRLTAAD
jgi:hypothetical protein